MSGVALLTYDTDFGRHMARRLSIALSGGAEPLGAILAICQGGEDAPRGRLHRFRRRAAWWRRRITGQARLDLLVQQYEREAHAEFLESAGPPSDWPENVPRLEVTVAEVNARTTAAWLLDVAPTLLAVAGAPILGREILGIPSRGTLNMHSSLLPDYRGTRAEFWQVHDRNLESAGLTIHFAEAGIDSGDIVLQRPLDAKLSDGPWRMRARNQFAGLSALPDAVISVLQDSAERRPQPPCHERPYRFSDITPEATWRVIQTMGRPPWESRGPFRHRAAARHFNAQESSRD